MGFNILFSWFQSKCLSSNIYLTRYMSSTRLALDWIMLTRSPPNVKYVTTKVF